MSADDAALAGADGFVDTGDMVELRGDRYVFAGRRGGIINIGGLKVHPGRDRGGDQPASAGAHVAGAAEVEPDHRLDRDRRRGVEMQAPAPAAADLIEVKGDILKLCRDALPRHKVPAAISFVPALDVAATGKLVRRHG